MLLKLDFEEFAFDLRPSVSRRNNRGACLSHHATTTELQRLSSTDEAVLKSWKDNQVDKEVQRYKIHLTFTCA